MLENFGADNAGASAATDEDDARSTALRLMSEALARLDSDGNIPAVIGAHLQTAIDALWTSGSAAPHSIHLH
jgi:hypothetical protein